MRLLRLKDNGALSLAEYAEREVPPYAILSHRWGKDQDEVTFKDIIESTGTNKAGYQKIISCGHQAAKDGLGLFWVDTCCIDKSSSAELSEAINSMWRWYRDSEICYAYLDDVKSDGRPSREIRMLRDSKWFTRGWCLQELLAPTKLVLYNVVWEFLGTREALAERISKITGIDTFYLGNNGASLAMASIAERMSWASDRETKRSEDIAYCLLGIFNINMPLLYGEGSRAFRRLQEEIMKQSDDQSIFAWSPYGYAGNGPVLAESPQEFRNCGNIVRSINPRLVKSYAVTNRGLEIELPLLIRDGKTLAGLNCRYREDFLSDLALPLHNVYNDREYSRAEGYLKAIPFNEWNNATSQHICIKLNYGGDVSRHDLKSGSILLRDLPSNYKISQVYPSWAWNPETRVIEGPTRRPPEHLGNRRLIRITSMVHDDGTIRTTLAARHHCVIMIHHRKGTLDGSSIIEANLMPEPIGEDTNLSELHYRYEFEDISRSRRAQRQGLGMLLLNSSSPLVRGRRLTILEVLVTKDRYLVITGAIGELIAVTQYVVRDSMSRLIHRYFPQNVTFANVIVLQAFALCISCFYWHWYDNRFPGNTGSASVPWTVVTYMTILFWAMTGILLRTQYRTNLFRLAFRVEDSNPYFMYRELIFPFLIMYAFISCFVGSFSLIVLWIFQDSELWRAIARSSTIVVVLGILYPVIDTLRPLWL